MSRWGDIVDLIKETNGTDEEGYPAIVEMERKGIFANRKSIRSAEFYQASSVGYALEAMFIIRSEEYEDEELLRYNDKKFSIIRTYDKGEFIELICADGSTRKFR